MSGADTRTDGAPDVAAGAATAPAPTCACGGQTQYVTYPDGDHAAARVCECAAACPRCDGVGHLTETDADGYLYVRPCRCSYLNERVALYNAARLPARYHKKTIEGRSRDAYENRGGNQNVVWHALVRYRKNYRTGQRGILLMGGPGTGKTHLLVALLSYLSIERGYRCRYIDFMTLLSELKEGFNQNRPEADLIGPLVRVPILAVDELGKGRNSDWELAVLDEIISQRYNARRTTFFATNFRDEPAPLAAPTAPPGGWRSSERAEALVGVTLEERVGPRIYSRLKDMCEFQLVEGPDSRQKKR